MWSQCFTLRPRLPNDKNNNVILVKNVQLNEVQHLPYITLSLIFISRLTERDLMMAFDDVNAVIISRDSFMRTQKRVKKMFVVDQQHDNVSGDREKDSDLVKISKIDQ